jgi:uncharacterized repeat protein (TIGR01451 family)
MGVRELALNRHHLPHTPLLRGPRVILILALIASGILLIGDRSRTSALTGAISGVVFLDYNANGARDTATIINNTGSGTSSVAFDAGLPGITVTAYTSSGAVAASTVTGPDGSYTLNTNGTVGPYRVEFTNLPPGYCPGPVGPNSLTTVQFVPEGGASNVNVGLVIPTLITPNNPTLAVPCYVVGDQNNTLPVIISFPYNSGSTNRNPDPPFNEFDAPEAVLARANQVGTTWGLDYSATRNLLYASAFMKKYSGFGPGGTGAIYQVDASGSGAVSEYANLNTLFGAGTAGVSTHDFTLQNGLLRDGGNASWNAVGKISLGGLAVSDDERYLFVMNLANKRLYRIRLDVAPTPANTLSAAVPIPASCPAGDVAPFAVKFYLGSVYVGLTCTAESTQNAAQLAAYVYRADPETLAFSALPVFQAPLNYPRRCADGSNAVPPDTPDCISALWKPWVPTFNNIGVGPDNSQLLRLIYPQPWLTDIDFDQGNMILSIRDRLGDQGGLASVDDPNSNTFYYAVAAGDILRACGNPATGWGLENNASCGGVTTAGANNGQGPGGGEYYYEDNSFFHDEISMGSIIQLPGFPDVVATAHDLIPVRGELLGPGGAGNSALFDGGVRYFSNFTGQFTRNARIYDGEPPAVIPPTGPGAVFGKANGLGDLAAIIPTPPLEIGNYVWRDDNRNGVQDPNEPALAGVTVQLYEGAALVGTTVTSATGNYYFNNVNVAGGLKPNTAYEARISLLQGPLTGLDPTTPNQGTDIHDSDAVLVGTNAVIALTTGVAGCSDHTFDFGFQVRPTEADLELRKTGTPACIEPGDDINFRVTVRNLGPARADNVVVTDQLPNGVTLENISPAGVCTGTSTLTCNLGSLVNGASFTINIRVRVSLNFGAVSYTNWATVTSSTPDPNPYNNTDTATVSILIAGNPNTPVGPGEAFPPGAVSDQKAGSVLFYNIVTSSPSALGREDTRINITNTNPGMYVFVHLFFVDGSTCSVADNFLCLTANQTASFTASEFDPGTTGYLVAVAVDENGCPIAFNHLIGDEYVKLASGHAANLGAEAFARLPNGTAAPLCDANSVTTTLVFNGTAGNYENAPRVLAVSGIGDLASGNQPLLILNRFGGDLLTGAARIPALFGILYDDQENAYSFTLDPRTCQYRNLISNDFPRTTPRFGTVVPLGHTGWMKLWASVDAGLLGAVINYNPNAETSPTAYNDGHNLHKLTLVATESLTIPVFPPGA